jgi:hypothetical protein
MDRFTGFFFHHLTIRTFSGGLMVSSQESEDRKPLFQRSAEGVAFFVFRDFLSIDLADINKLAILLSETFYFQIT